MQLLGVVAGAEGVADDRVLIDAGQAAGLPDATAFAEVMQDRDDLVVRESSVEQGRALALGEAILAGTAGEHAALLVPAVAESDPEVATAALAVIGAIRVLATEAVEVVVHRAHQGRAFKDS